MNSVDEKNLTIAYISRLVYPDPTAAALQTMQMAAAFARQTGDAHLFVHDLADSEETTRQQYAVDGSPLRIWLLHAKRWPSLFYGNGKARFLTYNSAVAAILGFHPAWRQTSGQRQVLFVRSRLESLYWGLMRPYLWWLRDWVFIYEAHDLQVPLLDGESVAYDYNSPRVRRTARALKNYDLVLAITRHLAEDIQVFTQGSVKPKVVPLCTGLQRLRRPPVVRLSSDQVVLGYIGTVDIEHGIGDLSQAMQMLPENCILRIVGRVRAGAKTWLDQWMENPAGSGRIELRPPVSYSEVAAEIDACDIVLAPVGDTVHSKRYRSPLKLFDYMARGKPIVAAGVPCHLELLQDGVNARIYRPGDPEDLAACIMSLVEQPQQAEAIARTAWEQSTSYTYDARARRILELVDEVWEERHAKRSA